MAGSAGLAEAYRDPGLLPALKILMALLDILDCTMGDLIEPIAVAGAVKKPKRAAVGGTAPDTEGLAGLRPKRARIKGVERS
ncbi:helix-turn-helix domain-containing protein [Streptomyces sp. NBC_00078]|uniref:helix-turn-helix domain-containing protein n=1 Tax=unclassified Streptomyces TaxID=2593676 RepID=UPI00225B07B7|nr:helix-turn-helix domain-containing protein [Streptomyces sp. NBC_00078]MCX5426065.1 helix-turn-helix transcriptional regulator [Streptomyces sp. NBC_00078]